MGSCARARGVLVDVRRATRTNLSTVAKVESKDAIVVLLKLLVVNNNQLD